MRPPKLSDPPNRSRLWIAIAAAALMGAGAWIFRPPQSEIPKPPPARLPTQAPVESWASTLPIPRGADGYTGAAACAECHESQHASWWRSHHSRMTQVVNPGSVQAPFEGERAEFMGEKFTFFRKGPEYWIRVEDPSATSGPGGEAEEPFETRLTLVTGSHHMHVFWMPTRFGNMQVGLPFTWLFDEKKWVPRNNAFIRPPGEVTSKEVWNVTCIRCHTTGGIPSPNLESDIFESKAGDLGISCEACHGPGADHVRLARELKAKGTALPDYPPDLHTLVPKDLPHPQNSQVCAHCHSMKWFDQSEDWMNRGFSHKPGDDIEQTTPVMRPSKLDEQPWLKAVLEKHPEIMEQFFWKDGMIRVAGREYNGLVESPCFQNGALSCFSCHSMHQSDPNDQLAKGMETNQACLQCHSDYAGKLEAHTRHGAGSPGSLCYNCHMPHTAYALLKGVRSHQVSNPSVRESIDFGRPNACNLCHLDETLAWTAGHLNTWHGQPIPALDDDAKTRSAAASWLLKGDAGQRALMAWHWSWPPARQASPGQRDGRLLLTLLEDPYAAVRLIAHRSLTQLGIAPANYDPTPDPTPTAKQPAHAPGGVNLEPAAAAKLFQKPNGDLDLEAIAAWQAQRDNRPMRLRE